MLYLCLTDLDKHLTLRLMPKFLLYFLLLLPLVNQAQNSSNIRFYMDICRFREITRTGNSIELLFSVDGSSIINEKGTDGKFYANVSLEWYLQKLDGRDSLPVGSDKVILDWPEDSRPTDTSETTVSNSLYMVEPLILDPGNYVLRGYAEDGNSIKPSSALSTYAFEVPDYGPLEFSFSDIKWISSIDDLSSKATAAERSKINGRGGGVPLINNDTFFNPDTLIFHQQFYNVNGLIGDDDSFFLRSRLLRGDRYLSGYSTDEQSREPRILRVDGKKRSYNAFLSQIHIRDLKSGFYFLQVEVLNKKKGPLKTYKKKFYVYNSRIDLELGAFSRETDIFNEYDEEELDYYLGTLVHTANSQEKNFIKVLNEYEQKKNYQYSFFEKRRKADQTVLALWKNYLLSLKFVNSKYNSLLREGWETDRGRVTLKYGLPSDIEVKSLEPNLLPHEIWYYDRLGVQTNVIFVFFENDMKSGEYYLLHSSKYGEKSNTRWRSQLTLQNNPSKKY